MKIECSYCERVKNVKIPDSVDKFLDIHFLTLEWTCPQCKEEWNDAMAPDIFGEREDQISRDSAMYRDMFKKD